MWNIPPIIGQKVMLNPSYSHYKAFNDAQAKGSDGYIISVNGMNTLKWLLDACKPTTTILWENGHVNSYEIEALLPIDSFKTVERVEFMSGGFLQVYNQKMKDQIAEQVIVKNNDIKHYSFFDKEKRMDILTRTENSFLSLGQTDKDRESVQMKYMSILEEMERTKRAEESVLFLEGDDVSTRKKHQSGSQTSFNPFDLEPSEVLVEGFAPGRIINVPPRNPAPRWTGFFDEDEDI